MKQAVSVPVCRVCKSSAFTPVLDLGEMPIAHRILSERSAPEDVFPFRLDACINCGFVQNLNPIDPAELYRQFNYNFSSWKIEPHMDDELQHIFAFRPFESALDIGCNDGLFLNLLRERGARRAVGVEPNPVSMARARERGLTVYNSMLDQDVTDQIISEQGRFDLVVSRQVIEHVPDLDLFFGCVVQLLKDDGFAFFDLPDFDPGRRAGDCSTLWEEHVNYFTERTLSMLLATHGLEIAKLMRYDFSGGALAVLATRVQHEVVPRKGEPSGETERFGERVREYGERLRAALSRARNLGYEVAMYGAGVRACTASNGLRLGEFIDVAIDDQPERQGKFLPGSRLPIVSRSSLTTRESPLVVLLAVNAENDENVKRAVVQEVSRPIEFVALCSPSDIWGDLRALEALS